VYEEPVAFVIGVQEAAAVSAVAQLTQAFVGAPDDQTPAATVIGTPT
jgi:hypothetical protein